ncbi:MAG: DNA repair photolyase [Clostridia bacterium 62_21]|nr:MAG: DNA repair photolyase [Clostridia bacterium 62_21]
MAGGHRRQVMAAVRVGKVTCKSALNRTGIPGYRYCLNPYAGCGHGCLYCYAACMARFATRQEPWGSFVDVKVNLVEVLRRQLACRKPPVGKVILGTVTDAYQPVEAQAGVTRSCLEVMRDHPGLEVDILTKSDLVVRDLPLLLRLEKCSVGFTITTLSERAARILEPGAASPGARLMAARRLKEAGLDVWVFVAPLLPGIGDTEEALGALLLELRRVGIPEVHVDPLNPYPSVARRLRPVYRRHFSQAFRRLERYLADPQAYRLGLVKVLRKLSRRFGYNLSLP